MAFTIITQSEDYSVNDLGDIGRPKLNMAPSGQWKAVALVRPHGFGTAEVIPFAEWTAERLSKLQWLYKNGKPRYTLRDLDHGTLRQWGNYIQRIYRDCQS